MKKLLFLVFVILCNYSAHANLAYEKEYWIEEISKRGVLNHNMISRHFDVSLESFAENIFGGSESDVESWRKITLIIAEVIKSNSARLKSIILYGFNDQKFNNFYANTILEAVIYSKTIETLDITRVPDNAAFKVANIIKMNKIIKRLDLGESEFTDKGALVIAQSLSTNNTLQTLRMPYSKFSMSSRAALRKAWAMNKVEGRTQDIEF